MSTEKIYTHRVKGFGERFLDAFNNANIAEIARLTGKTYQGIKNYAAGRIPEWKILFEISDSTGCSIHWLLTGEGEKYVGENVTSVTKSIASETVPVDTAEGEWKLFSALVDGKLRLRLQRGDVEISYTIASMTHDFTKPTI